MQANIDKYFQNGQVTQIIGSNSSNKHRIIILFLLKKIIQEKIKVCYLDTELSFPASFIQSAIDKICSKEEFKVKKPLLEDSFHVLRFSSTDFIGNFIEESLEKILVNEFKVLVVENLSSFFGLDSKKNSRNYMRLLLNLARIKKITVIYVNNVTFQANSVGGFSLEISSNDLITEFCNHVLYITDCRKEEDNPDKVRLISGIKVLKSEYNENFEIRLDLKEFSFTLKKKA